jgi:hypothetical protein
LGGLRGGVIPSGQFQAYCECATNGTLIAETSYGYDADGNRTSRTTLTGAETYSYQPGFKLASVARSNAPSDTFAADAGGRMISRERGATVRTIDYDSMDHITNVHDGIVDVAYSFDGAGRRVSATANGTVKKFGSPHVSVGA